MTLSLIELTDKVKEIIKLNKIIEDIELEKQILLIEPKSQVYLHYIQ